MSGTDGKAAMAANGGDALPQGNPATDAELEGLWREFLAAPPLLTLAELDELTGGVFGRDGLRATRAGLVVLTKTGADLAHIVAADPSGDGAAVWSELAEVVEDWAPRFRNLAQALDAAGLRLRMALCEVEGRQ